MTMHCGYLVFLFLALWAGLAGGRVLPSTETTDPDMQSIIEDLQVALQSYNSALKETNKLENLPDLPCTETAAHLEQTSAVVLRLSQYQLCAEQLAPLCPDTDALCRVVLLNRDLLQHLSSSYEDTAGCPTPPSTSTSSSPSDFNTLRKFIQCVHCWSQQVAALRR